MSTCQISINSQNVIRSSLPSPHTNVLCILPWPSIHPPTLRHRLPEQLTWTNTNVLGWVGLCWLLIETPALRIFRNFRNWVVDGKTRRVISFVCNFVLSSSQQLIRAIYWIRQRPELRRIIWIKYRRHIKDILGLNCVEGGVQFKCGGGDDRVTVTILLVIKNWSKKISSEFQECSNKVKE